MLWYLPWSESIKKRACRYLLQRYLGNFLEEKLTLDQLSVDIYNGTGTVCDVSLDCEALNELGDTQNWPLEIVDGYVQKIMVTIPWSTLLKDDSIVEVHGLSLTVQPKVRAEPVSSMLESMWSSMSSSMQLAEECLREESGPQDTHPVEGIEMFAHAIDSILSRVKVRFIDTKIRIEHVPKNSQRGIALELHIKCINYYDEAGTEPTPESTDPDKTKTYIVSTYVNKRIKFNDITLYTDEFPSKLRTMARSLIMEKSSSTQADKSEHSQTDPSDTNYQSTLSDVFYETRSVISTIDPDPIREIIGETSHSESQREPTPEEKASQPDPILFAKLTGMQELALKIKHTEEIEGPKIEFKMMFGSLFVFISPRQLHTLTELVTALNQPHLEDTSNIPLRPNSINTQCKPMQRADFQLIEAQLLGNLERENTKPNPAMYGWSGQSFDESDSESDKFLPMSSPGNLMSESYSSSVSSMTTSMTSSVNIPSSQPRIKRNKKVPCIDGDPTAEVSHISLRVASVSCILLHKDVLVSSPSGSDLVSPSTVTKMQEASNEFFNRLQPFCIIDDFVQANICIDSATERNHLRLIASDIKLDGSDKTTAQGNQMHCEAAIKNVLVRECLYSTTDIDVKAEGYDIIRFEAKDEEESGSSRESTAGGGANIRVNFKHTSKYVRVAGERKLVNPTTDLVIKLTPVQCDVELTIMDRMAATFFGNTGVSSNTSAAPRPQNQLNLNVHCPCLSALLRFPIADLRPGINREIRRVRPDYLEFKFQNAIINCHQLQSVRPLPTTVTLKTTTLDLYYHENDTLPATHIARSSMDNTLERNILRAHTNSPLPTISLTFQPKKQQSGPFEVLEDTSFHPATNPMTTSMYIMNNLNTGHPSPFSGKKMAYQSVTKHEGSMRGQDEELIVPGTEEEMTEFTNDSVEHSAIHLDFTLPVLSLQLESKQLYEIIYNRINSDLLLWEPQVAEHFDITPQFAAIYPAFGMCKGSGYDSESESSSSEEENLYYSTYDNKLKKGIGGTKTVTEPKDTHNFCLTLKIGEGLLTIYAPYRDSNKLVVPGHMGELVLEAHKLSMCQVTGINGKPKTAQMCLRAQKTTLYHEAILSIPSERPPLRVYGSTLPSYLKTTIYPSGKGVQVKEKIADKDMFSMALKAEPDPETPKLKTICITLGIEQATLRHRGDKGIAWLTQLMDVLDVLDYPVPGYSPSTVLSQLHVHVWACAIDYRPIYLPIRTVVTLNNFTVTSNIIPETNTSCLRFLAQECSLYLNHIICSTKPNVPVPLDDDKLPDLNKDYVCVVDVGLFELSLRMEDKSKGQSSSQPAVDVSVCNNHVSLYTCWDSASALCRVLTYAAADGDCCLPEPELLPDPLHTLIGLDDRPIEEIRELSPSEIQQVNELMAEAMKESPNTTLDDEELHSSTEKEGVEIFFFPDESNMKLRPPSEDPEFDPEYRSLECEELKPVIDDILEEHKLTNAQVAKDLGDPNVTPSSTPKKSKRKKVKSGGEGNNTDDEFCIVETQAQCEDNDLEEPLVQWLGQGPAYMYDNHFTVPPARTDVLKAPKSFPNPILRYTLCEMSVTWNMFGGTDFKTENDTTVAKKSVTIDADVKLHGSPVSAKRSLDYEAYERERTVAAAYRSTGVRWSAGGERVTSRGSRVTAHGKARGGAHRDHNVAVKLCLNKVKFQYEVYPTGGIHASRHTLAISKIEVLDRLLCSDINKLLSQYKLKDEPERNNAHMLIIKAVHLRPEPTLSAQECCLKVSLLPLRFNLDQDTLAFLVGFFSKLGSDEATGDEDVKSISGLSTESSGSRQTTPTHRPPVMSIASHLKDPPPTPTSLGDADALSLNDTPLNLDSEPLMETYEAERLVTENLIQLEEDFQKLGVQQEKPATKTTVDYDPPDDSPIYFRRVVFSPEVPIRLDYVGKRVDLSAGPIAGLLMGLGQLNCSELTLKRLDYKLGLLGLEKLVQWALHEWLADVKRHQLPSLLSGIGPMHSLLQLITGIRDLVWLPVEQWRRDGRLVHGLRRGAASFTARTAVAALDITARLLHLIQATAETAFDMLTPGPTLQLQAAYERRQTRRRRRRDPARQPADIREGVATAYQTVKEGFQETASTMAIAARTSSGAGVLRHLPGCAVAPLALAAAGAADLLGGVRAHLAPHTHRDTADKWRHRGPPDPPN